MKKLKSNKWNPKYWWLARRNKKLQYHAEYEKVLEECEGDIDCAEMIMFIRSYPDFDEGPSLSNERPKLELVKKKHDAGRLGTSFSTHPEKNKER